MKKNKMMRLASTLMVAVLMTTCTISGTYAKYVTAADAADLARVAKWGVVVSATGSLYGEKYASADSKITAVEDTNDAGKAIVSVYGKQWADNNKVVAPGTQSDEGFHFDINGNPEVDALVTVQMEHQNVFLAEGSYGVMVEVVDVTEDNFPAAGLYTKDGDNYTLTTAWDGDVEHWFALHDAATVENEDGYWPVVYKMESDFAETSHEGDVDGDTLKAIADKIVARFTDTEAGFESVDGTHTSKYTYTDLLKNIEQNQDLDDVLELGDIKLSWAWDFGTPGVASGYDALDTILGNLMAERIGQNFAGDVVKSTGTGTFGPLTEGTDFCLDTNFSIEILVEQVD